MARDVTEYASPRLGEIERLAVDGDFSPILVCFKHPTPPDHRLKTLIFTRDNLRNRYVLHYDGGPACRDSLERLFRQPCKLRIADSVFDGPVRAVGRDAIRRICHYVAKPRRRLVHVIVTRLRIVRVCDRPFPDCVRIHQDVSRTGSGISEALLHGHRLADRKVMVPFRREEFTAGTLNRTNPLLLIVGDRPVDGILSSERLNVVAAAQDLLHSRLGRKARKQTSRNATV